MTRAVLFSIVRNSKTSGFELSLQFIAGEAMDITFPFDMVPGIYEISVFSEKAANASRAMDDSVIRVCVPQEE